MQKILNIIIILSLILAYSCKKTSKEKSFQQQHLVEKKMEYAKGFKMYKSEQGQKLVIYNPQNIEEKLAEFELVTKKTKAYQIEVPCKRIICLSTTQLAYFFELDYIDPIVATNSSRHLFNKKMNIRIKNGSIKKVGKEGNFNTELIAALNPDIIFVSPFKSGGYDALRNLGFQLVPMAAYNETNPLARAEWIKMIAAFIGKEKDADSIFNNTQNEYLKLKNLTKSIHEKPSVFSGKMKNGIWYVPGGKSFISHYINDAGANYIIKDNKVGAYPMDFESLYQMAAKADYWRLQTSSPKGFDKKMLIAEDRRYQDFKAYKTGNVLVCNIREKPFYEQNPVKPHQILADYIFHIHPELLPGYLPVFYEKIK